MAEKKYLNDTGLAEVAKHVNSRLKTVTTMPASADDGAVRLYVGASNATYEQGHIYQYDLTNTKWEDITPADTKIFTGTSTEWNNLSLTEKQKYEICNITDDGSTDNVYTVGEVDALLDEKLSYADNGILGAKNLLHYPYVQTTQTKYGVTFTDNGDGTLTISGTQDGSSSKPYFGCGQWWETDKKRANFYLKQGMSIIVSVASSDDNIGVRVFAYNASGTNIFDNAVYGSQELTVGGFSVDAYIAVCVETKANSSTISNVKVYPMLRLASDPDSTYQPYAMTNRELTELKTYITPNIGARFYKIGRVCYVSFESAVADKAYVDGDIMDTIPEEFRPIYSSSFIDTLGTAHSRMIIDANIWAKGSFAAGQNIRGYVTYITNN